MHLELDSNSVIRGGALIFCEFMHKSVLNKIFMNLCTIFSSRKVAFYVLIRESKDQGFKSGTIRNIWS